MRQRTDTGTRRRRTQLSLISTSSSSSVSICTRQTSQIPGRLCTIRISLALRRPNGTVYAAVHEHRYEDMNSEDPGHARLPENLYSSRGPKSDAVMQETKSVSRSAVPQVNYQVTVLVVHGIPVAWAVRVLCLLVSYVHVDRPSRWSLGMQRLARYTRYSVRYAVTMSPTQRLARLWDIPSAMVSTQKA